MERARACDPLVLGREEDEEEGLVPELEGVAALEHDEREEPGLAHRLDEGDELAPLGAGHEEEEEKGPAPPEADDEDAP